MATADIVLLFINLFSRLQSCVAVHDWRIRCRRLSYDVLHLRCLPRSHGSLSRLLPWSSLLVLPPFQDVIHSLRAPRRFWAAPSRTGLLGEGRVSLMAEHGEDLPWLGTELLSRAFQNVKRYILVSLPNLWQVFEKATTHLQQPLVPAMRVAIVLHWLAQASSFSELAAMYAVGKSTVATIVHEGITIHQERLVPEVILFPNWARVGRVMVDFEALLPCCGRALDGTFMPMKKPSELGIIHLLQEVYSHYSTSLRGCQRKFCLCQCW